MTEVIQKKGMAYLIIGVGINLATDPEVVRNINSPVGSLFKHIEPEELERVRSLILSCACEEIIRAVRSLPEKFSAEEIKEWNHSDLYKGRKLRLKACRFLFDGYSTPVSDPRPSSGIESGILGNQKGGHYHGKNSAYPHARIHPHYPAHLFSPYNCGPSASICLVGGAP